MSSDQETTTSKKYLRIGRDAAVAAPNDRIDTIDATGGVTLAQDHVPMEANLLATSETDQPNVTRPTKVA